MIPVVSFIGWHNSGKTTLIRKVVKELSQMGIKTGIIKDTKHYDIIIDKKGSDSSLYREDGIETVSLVTPKEIHTIQDNKKQPLNYLFFKIFSESDVDLIIAEGFKHSFFIPKIEVARAAISKELIKNSTNNIKAIVSDFPVDFEPHFTFQQTKDIASFIIDNFINGEQNNFIEVFADGKRLPLNNFVNDALRGTLLGFLSALKFTDDVDTLEIKIKNYDR